MAVRRGFFARRLLQAWKEAPRPSRTNNDSSHEFWHVQILSRVDELSCGHDQHIDNDSLPVTFCECWIGIIYKLAKCMLTA